MTRALALASGLALLVGGAVPHPAAAQEAAGGESPAAASQRTGDELDDLTARVADRLRCPVCRNQSVLESSSTLAREMQAEIRRRLARGESPEEVEAYFVSRYGEWILLQPPARGINLLVYVLPVVALLLGGWVVVRLVRRWTADGESTETAAGAADAAPGGPPDSGEAGLSPEEERQLEEALGREAGTSRRRRR